MWAKALELLTEVLLAEDLYLAGGPRPLRDPVSAAHASARVARATTAEKDERQALLLFVLGLGAGALLFVVEARQAGLVVAVITLIVCVARYLTAPLCGPDGRPIVLPAKPKTYSKPETESSPPVAVPPQPRRGRGNGEALRQHAMANRLTHAAWARKRGAATCGVNAESAGVDGQVASTWSSAER